MSHSRSPAIHRWLLSHSGIDGTYETLRTPQDGLGPLLHSMSGGAWDGLNVTMPLKEMAVKLVDELGEEAARSGSVNTISMQSGLLVGDSTDSMAVSTLSRQDRFRRLETALVLGTGGAARAALSALTGTRRCFVSGRSIRRAKELAERLGCRSWEWSKPLDGALVVNATPVIDLDLALVAAAGGLIDLPYGPHPTQSVLTANERGISSVDGVEFLLTQAVESFRIWTGVEVAAETLIDRFRNT